MGFKQKPQNIYTLLQFW